MFIIPILIFAGYLWLIMKAIIWSSEPIERRPGWLSGVADFFLVACLPLYLIGFATGAGNFLGASFGSIAFLFVLLSVSAYFLLVYWRPTISRRVNGLAVVLVVAGGAANALFCCWMWIGLFCNLPLAVLFLAVGIRFSRHIFSTEEAALLCILGAVMGGMAQLLIEPHL